MNLIIIAAMDRNLVIGNNGSIPWRLSGDMKHFKNTTSGCPIIMGRKTWDTIGRPLPDRRNIVITRNEDFVADGVEVVHNFVDAVELVKNEECSYVIGGAEIYKLAFEYADEMILTHVDAEVDGDVKFPPFSIGKWRQYFRENYEADDKNEYDYFICRYLKNN